jgi:hypothetical protein
MSGDTADISVEGKPWRMSWMAWVIVGMCLVGYYFCFKGVMFLWNAGSLYEAALAGTYNPTIKFVRYLTMAGCVPFVLIAVVLAPSMYRWVRIPLIVMGVGLFGAACWLSDYSGTTHSEAFLRGIGDRMIKAGDIAALKTAVAKRDGYPERSLNEDQRASLKRVVSLPEYSLDSVEGRDDVVVVTYGRILHVMVGPDDMQAPVGWESSRAVKVSPGVFLIGGENVW